MGHKQKNTSSRKALPLNTHVGGLLLLIGSAIIVIGIWIAVQASRTDPLPTLVWAKNLSDAELMTASPLVLDRLGNGWWWVYAGPKDREKLRQAGVAFAVAMPTPLAQMAGCSMPPLDYKLSP